MQQLLQNIQACTVCSSHLEWGPRPVITAHPNSKLVLIGQAPGKIVHESGIPWDDKSGENLRSWLGISRDNFYDPRQVALIPMGFCYPGKGKSGDLPPRKECAPLWHALLWAQMPQVQLTVLIGQYAQNYYLGSKTKRTLTDTVRHFQDYLPEYFVLPHPSPRNNIWKKKNPWFETDVLPVLKKQVQTILI